MAGLAGIVDFSGRLRLFESLNRMVERMFYGKWFRIEKIIEPPVALSRVGLKLLNPYPQPVEERDRLVFLYGEIYHDRLINDASYILSLYNRKGLEAFPLLNGKYSLAIWDRKERSLIIATDRLGLSPIFYYEGPSLLIFASDVKAILGIEGVPSGLDEYGMVEFLSLEYLLGERTLFKSIKYLEPGRVKIFKKGKSSILRYWRPEYRWEGRKTSIEEGAEILKRAVKKRIAHRCKVGIYLSGGLDSRTILSSTLKYIRPIAYTVGDENSLDVRLAEEVAGLAGVEHILLKPSPSSFWNFIEKGIWYTDGFNNCINFLGDEFLDRVRERTPFILRGFGGEALGTWADPRLSLLPSFPKFLHYVYHKIANLFPPSLHKRLFTPDFYKRVAGYLYQELERIFSDTKDLHPIDRYHQFKLMMDLPRYGVPGITIIESQVGCLEPFTDNEFIDFILRLSPKQRVLWRAERGILKYLNPALASIPWEKLKIPPDSGDIKIAYYLLRRRIFPSQGGSVAYPEWFRKELRGRIRETLLKGDDLGIFNRKFLEELLNLHFSGRVDASRQIGALLTLKIWARLFLR